MSLVLDAGALIALDRGDRRLRKVVSAAFDFDEEVLTSAAVVAQVWRNGARQAELARVLGATLIVPLEDEGAREVGTTLAATGGSDVVDAHLARLVAPNDVVLTSDPADIKTLLDVRGVRALVTAV